MIAILQPLILHYREDFYKHLNLKESLHIYCYEDSEWASSDNFKEGQVKTMSIPNIQLGPFLFYNPFTLLKKDYNTLVLMLNFTHISTWLLLLTRFLHRKKIILWGHGISVNRYLKEEKKPDFLLKWMISLADVVWLYTKKQQAQWKAIFPNKRVIALNNTISEINYILNYESKKSIDELKLKYVIKEETCFIFCARFNNPKRRIDLLLKIIQKLDAKKFGFIIIGDGPAKPSFLEYPNVYDYGSVYDREQKDELFTIANLYIQPGWVGLSVVEAMAYGKPVLTFKRSENTLQCVEYDYLMNKENALIFEDLDDLFTNIPLLKGSEIKKMSNNAKVFVKNNLMPEYMVSQALCSLI